MYKYTQAEFVAMMDELMDKFKKGCQKSDAELEAAYKILNPTPVGGFIDSLVKMDKYYGTDLWEIKRKQIKCFISKCDRYDKSIAEECDVCIFADSTILSPEWPYLCAKVYVSITWIDEGKTSYTRIFPSAAGFMSYQIESSPEDDRKPKEHMSILEMRECLKISRAEFSRRYHIPLRTLENWESATNQCPGYVMNLLERAVLEDADRS